MKLNYTAFPPSLPFNFLSSFASISLLHFPPSTPSFLLQETCLELGLSVSSCLSALLTNYFPSTKLIISVTGDQPVSSTVLVQQALCTPLEKNGQMLKGEQRLKSDSLKVASRAVVHNLPNTATI